MENYMAAILAVDGLVSDEAIVKVARNFGGVEGRMERILAVWKAEWNLCV